MSLYNGGPHMICLVDSEYTDLQVSDVNIQG